MYNTGFQLLLNLLIALCTNWYVIVGLLIITVSGYVISVARLAVILLDIVESGGSHD